MKQSSKLILGELKVLNKLANEPSTFSNRRAIRKSLRLIKKLVRAEAKNCASITYSQTVDFYKGFLEDNLDEKIKLNF